MTERNTPMNTTETNHVKDINETQRQLVEELITERMKGQAWKQAALTKDEEKRQAVNEHLLSLGW